MARRRFDKGALVVASHNDGKLREIIDLLKDFDCAPRGAKALGLAEPEETGDSFIANAELKALAAARASGLPALADDSGLAVDALDGAPGIYSARWAERPDGGRDFAFAMQKIQTELAGQPKAAPDARFVCALSLAWPDGHVESVAGQVLGRLTFPPRGANGFGYDPIFLPQGYDMTFGEMPPAAKHAISHRADAFAKLVAACFDAR